MFRRGWKTHPKAAITIPIMAPFSDLVGVSRQAMVLGLVLLLATLLLAPVGF